MSAKGNWARRRWLDFRQGHTIYLALVVMFANFITIQYALLVDRVSWLNSAFTNIWIFAVVFIAIYMPIAMAVGYWHRKSQMKVDQEAIFYENVIGARMWLFMLELIEGNVTEEEKKEMRDLLRKIIQKEQSSSDAKKENAIGDTREESKSVE